MVGLNFRAKLPAGQGLWPAIWMLPTEEDYGTWAASGRNRYPRIQGAGTQNSLGTLHYGGSWPNNKHSGFSIICKLVPSRKDFHRFALEWEKGEIRWYIDGVLYQTQREWNSENGTFPAPFDSHFISLLILQWEEGS